MAIFHVPILRRDQYEAFRREVGPDLADTYDEWLKLIGDRRTEALRRGETLVEVEVNFDKFIEFCRTRGTSPNLKTLRDFAIEGAALK